MDKETVKILATAITIEIAHKYDRFFSGAEDDLFDLIEETILEENRKLAVDSKQQP
jgi:hypothetical protein